MESLFFQTVRTLREYDYPPDMEKLAVDNVLRQAESIADELTRNSSKKIL